MTDQRFCQLLTRQTVRTGNEITATIRYNTAITNDDRLRCKTQVIYNSHCPPDGPLMGPWVGVKKDRVDSLERDSVLGMRRSGQGFPSLGLLSTL